MLMGVNATTVLHFCVSWRKQRSVVCRLWYSLNVCMYDVYRVFVLRVESEWQRTRSAPAHCRPPLDAPEASSRTGACRETYVPRPARAMGEGDQCRRASDDRVCGATGINFSITIIGFYTHMPIIIIGLYTQLLPIIIIGLYTHMPHVLTLRR